MENRERASRNDDGKGLLKEEARIHKVAYCSLCSTAALGVEIRKAASSICPGGQLGRGWQTGKVMKARSSWGMGRG